MLHMVTSGRGKKKKPDLQDKSNSKLLHLAMMPLGASLQNLHAWLWCLKQLDHTLLPEPQTEPRNPDIQHPTAVSSTVV